VLHQEEPPLSSSAREWPESRKWPDARSHFPHTSQCFLSTFRALRESGSHLTKLKTLRWILIIDSTERFNWFYFHSIHFQKLPLCSMWCSLYRHKSTWVGVNKKARSPAYAVTWRCDLRDASNFLGRLWADFIARIARCRLIAGCKQNDTKIEANQAVFTCHCQLDSIAHCLKWPWSRQIGP
jgi:hypothetical protein